MNEWIDRKVIGLIGGMSWESSAEYYKMCERESSRALAVG